MLSRRYQVNLAPPALISYCLSWDRKQPPTFVSDRSQLLSVKLCVVHLECLFDRLAGCCDPWPLTSSLTEAACNVRNEGMEACSNIKLRAACLWVSFVYCCFIHFTHIYFILMQNGSSHSGNSSFRVNNYCHSVGWKKTVTSKSADISSGVPCRTRITASRVYASFH